MGTSFLGDIATGGLWSPVVAVQHGQGLGAAAEQSLTLAQAAPPPQKQSAPSDPYAAYEGQQQATALAAQRAAANQAGAFNDTVKRSLLG